MKKRVLAALLALVMLFGALPMSVFAEDLETVEGPSGTFEPDEPEKYTYHLYYDFNYVGTGSTKWNIEYGPTADTSYTYTVDSQTLTCREGYNFLGWADRNDSNTPDYTGGDEITLTWDNPTKTIYAVWKEKTQPDITDPTKVTPEFLDTASINYVCDTCTPPSYHIDITSAMYKVTEHSETTFRIKWNDEAILKAYNDLYPGHTWDEQGNGSSSYHIDPFAMTWTWLGCYDAEMDAQRIAYHQSICQVHGQQQHGSADRRGSERGQLQHCKRLLRLSCGEDSTQSLRDGVQRGQLHRGLARQEQCGEKCRRNLYGKNQNCTVC